MPTELSPSQYAAVQPLFAPLDFNLVIRSVIAGNTPARVYADHPANPRLAVMWDLQDAVLFAGDPALSPESNDLRAVIFEQILPNARSRGIPEMALLYTPALESALPVLLEGLELKPAGRYSYRIDQPQLEPPTFGGLPDLPEGFSLRRVDDALLSSHLANLPGVRGWIDSFWHNPQDFLHTGFGYCVLTGDTIAAWCLTVFAASSAVELGLMTVPAYRERGLATRAAVACIEHGLAHDLNIHWHCWADNYPSSAIAKKLGFRLERKYTVFRASIG